ncbi:hypothetical protein PIB30_004098 [Stylosanthes scabra]|uniref:BURP domain-containing protein n=1 Tax=Stylosanthes scabra TaxID=79078 RepID=A0ABU6Z1G2_9FABA|nr:hypothetical protein [Stylosanthes scabra]
MSLPNIKDNIPTIVFLPRSIGSKLPFSASGLSGIFNAISNESIMGMMIKESMEECMRLPCMFFRESMLKEGHIMQLSNIKDNIPTTVFLPRSIGSKLPFSTSGLSGIFKAIFNESIIGMMIKESVKECMRANSASETKRCVGSMKDMIDFATSILGVT